MVTREIRTIAGLIVLLPALVLTSQARADEAPASPKHNADAPSRPALHHAPVAVARSGQDLVIEAVFERPDLVKRAVVVYQHGSSVGEVPFERSSDSSLPYVAVIPSQFVRKPIVSYAVELETISGERVAVFGTRASPHPVAVVDVPENEREAALLRRADQRRSFTSLSSEYVYFGRSDASVRAPGAPVTVPPVTQAVRDQYFRVEAQYTYRLFRTVSEFGLRVGVVRGQSAVPNQTDASQFDVGLNYGAPRLRLRATDWLHVEGEFLTSVTEVGFSVGGGGALLLGDPYSSHVTMGFETVEVFGTRGYSRLDIVANRFLTISPAVEVTNMPHADRAGVRLTTDVGFDVGSGFVLLVRGGYQARSFNQGGPAIGGSIAYAF